MFKITNARTYAIIKSRKELEEAKSTDICMHIILEEGNIIYIWNRVADKWVKEKYVAFDKDKEVDEETTGNKAYMEFYYYCGREEVEKMKTILNPIDPWDSYEQMHYFNPEHTREKIYKTIYEFDANSSFTYGALQLPKGFEKLKEYLLMLYDKKQNSLNKITRAKYKNLQNYLIGYFARVKGFVSTRSEIIRGSNSNIRKKMAEIIRRNGTVYLSNTDSIVTDDIGAEVMQKYIGVNAGQFKLQSTSDKLCYNSSNSYQLGEKVVYSGVSYFARKHTDLFKEHYAKQDGSLIVGKDYSFEVSDEKYRKVCRIQYGEIKVYVINKIGEVIDKIIYKIGD